MSEPTVSIIVPVYQRLEFLRAALASVFAQTFSDWELIIADDGSGEPVRAYLRGLERDARITVAWLNHSGRPSTVRNAALREAKAKYVAFLDSDDLWLPQKLERQLAVMQTGSWRWSYTAFVRVNASGGVLANEEDRRWTAYDGDVFEQVVTTQASIRTPAVVVERELLMRVGGFDETLATAEDYDLWMRLALQSAVAVIDEPLVRVRLHSENQRSGPGNALECRDHSLKKLEGIADPQWRNLLRRERAINAVRLVRVHAAGSRYGCALRVLADSLSYSWRFLEWWWYALRAMLRPFIPPHVLGLRRRSSR